jgi:coniferyl-aldehyde dehydrogenase
MQADSPPAQNPIAEAWRSALQRQRTVYLAHPAPSLAERRADLQQLARFVQDNRQAILAAISADFGHRSTHDTLMLEFTPFLAGIRQCLQHVKRWMRPQRGPFECLLAWCVRRRRRAGIAGVGHAA